MLFKCEAQTTDYRKLFTCFCEHCYVNIVLNIIVYNNILNSAYQIL